MNFNKNFGLYVSFGGRDPIIHNLTEDRFPVKQTFVNKLFELFEEFTTEQIVKNQRDDFKFPLSTIIPTDYIIAEQILNSYYISKPYGYNVVEEESNLRMSYFFYKECVTLLRMFQNDTTNPLKLYQKRIHTVLRTYWDDSRVFKIVAEDEKNLETPSYIFDKGYKIHATMKLIGMQKRVDLNWLPFEQLLDLPLNIAYDCEGKLSLIEKFDMLQQLLVGWINFLHSHKNDWDLDVARLDAEYRHYKEKKINPDS